MQTNDAPIDYLLPQFCLINHKITKTDPGSISSASRASDIQQACKTLSSIVKLGCPKAEKVYTVFCSLIEQLETIYPQEEIDFIDLAIKDFLEVKKYAHEIYRHIKHEGLLAAYYINTYSALLIRKNEINSTINILAKFIKTAQDLSKREIFKIIEVSLAGCYFMVKNYEACQAVSKKLIKSFERSVLEELKRTSIQVSEETSKKLTVLLKAYLNLGLSSMFLWKEARSKNSTINSKNLKKIANDLESTEKTTADTPIDFKFIFMKGFNLGKKYLQNSQITQQFQLYMFESIKLLQSVSNTESKTGPDQAMSENASAKKKSNFNIKKKSDMSLKQSVSKGNNSGEQNDTGVRGSKTFLLKSYTLNEGVGKIFPRNSKYDEKGFGKSCQNSSQFFEFTENETCKQGTPQRENHSVIKKTKHATVGLHGKITSAKKPRLIISSKTTSNLGSKNFLSNQDKLFNSSSKSRRNLDLGLYQGDFKISNRNNISQKGFAPLKKSSFAGENSSTKIQPKTNFFKHLDGTDQISTPLGTSQLGLNVFEFKQKTPAQNKPENKQDSGSFDNVQKKYTNSSSNLSQSDQRELDKLTVMKQKLALEKRENNLLKKQLQIYERNKNSNFGKKIKQMPTQAKLEQKSRGMLDLQNEVNEISEKRMNPIVDKFLKEQNLLGQNKSKQSQAIKEENNRKVTGIAQSGFGLSERKVPVYQKSPGKSQHQTTSLNDLNEVESLVLNKNIVSVMSPSEISRKFTNKGSPFTPESTKKQFRDLQVIPDTEKDQNSEHKYHDNNPNLKQVESNKVQDRAGRDHYFDSGFVSQNISRIERPTKNGSRDKHQDSLISMTMEKQLLNESSNENPEQFSQIDEETELHPENSEVTNRAKKAKKSKFYRNPEEKNPSITDDTSQVYSNVLQQLEEKPNRFRNQSKTQKTTPVVNKARQINRSQSQPFDHDNIESQNVFKNQSSKLVLKNDSNSHQKTNLESTYYQSGVAHTQLSSAFNQPAFNFNYTQNQSDANNPAINQSSLQMDQRDLQSFQNMSVLKIMEQLRDSPIIQNSDSKYEQIKCSIERMAFNWEKQQFQNSQMLGEMRSMYNSLMMLQGQGQFPSYFGQQIPLQLIGQGFRPNSSSFFEQPSSTRSVADQDKMQSKIRRMGNTNQLETIFDDNESKFFSNDAITPRNTANKDPSPKDTDIPNSTLHAETGGKIHSSRKNLITGQGKLKSRKSTVNLIPQKDSSPKYHQNVPVTSMQTNTLNLTQIESSKLPSLNTGYQISNMSINQGYDRFNIGLQNNLTSAQMDFSPSIIHSPINGQATSLGGFSPKKKKLIQIRPDIHNLSHSRFGQQDLSAGTIPQIFVNSPSNRQIQQQNLSPKNTHGNFQESPTKHLLEGLDHLKSGQNLNYKQMSSIQNTNSQNQQSFSPKNQATLNSSSYQLMQEHFLKVQRQSMIQNNNSNILEDDQESQFSFPPPSMKQNTKIDENNLSAPKPAYDKSERDISDSRIEYLKKMDLSSLNISGNNYNSPFGFENDNYLFTMDGDILELESPQLKLNKDDQGEIENPNPIPIDLNSIKESIIGQRITLVQQFIKRGITLEVEISLFRQEQIEHYNFGLYDTMMDTAQFQINYDLKFELEVLHKNLPIDHELGSYAVQKLELSEGEFANFVASIDPNLLEMFPHEILSFSHAEYLLKIFISRFCDVEIDDMEKSIRVGLRNTLRPVLGCSDILYSQEYQQACKMNQKIQMAKANLQNGSPKRPKVTIPFRLESRKNTVLQDRKQNERVKNSQNVENFGFENDEVIEDQDLALKELELLPDPEILNEDGFRLTMENIDYRVVFFHNDQTEFLFVFEGIEDEKIHFKSTVIFVEAVFNEYFDLECIPISKKDHFKNMIIDEMEENDEFRKKLKREIRKLDDQKVMKNMTNVRKEKRVELTALLMEVAIQMAKAVEVHLALCADNEELFWSVRIVDKFESFIIFIIKDQPQQSQLELIILYRITSISKLRKFTLRKTDHQKTIPYSYFHQIFGVDFSNTHFIHKKYYIQIVTEMYNFLPMEHDEHYSESESVKDEAQKVDLVGQEQKPKKELFADFILKQKDFTIGAFKREYTGGNYKWPLTLSVVCLNDIPYGIRISFYDLADCTENGFYLSIYTSD